MATLAAIVGEELPTDAAEDSRNILPVLRADDNQTDSGSIIHHTNTATFALRYGKWKIIFGQGENRVLPTQGKGYLFDLDSDPRETTDVWNEHPEIVEELTHLMEKCR